MKIWTLALLIATTAATSAHAQDVDARWKAWLGCWQLTGGAGAEVCISPSVANGVTLTTRVSGESELTQTIVADAAMHPLADGSCMGTQRAEWSADGRRLFSSASVSCKEQPSRRISGLSLMTGSNSWLDVQAIEADGRTSVRVRQYHRPGTVAPSNLGTQEPLFSIDDVKEAAAKVAPEALEAALSEADSRFALNSQALIALDDANVPDSVIDLMVALSYPEKFQVERRSEPRFASSYSVDPFTTGEFGFWGLGYPYYSAYYDYLGYSRYYASPFGWVYPGGYFGAYMAPYYYGIRPGDGGTTTPGSTEDASVIDGVGYTRIRPRAAQRTDTSGEGRSSGSSAGRANVGSSGYSSGSSSSAGGSSPAPASGSGSSSGERTAQPR
jgi:hypothetical protein